MYICIYYCTREKKIDNARGGKLVLPFAVGWCRYFAFIITSISSQDTQRNSTHKRNHDITISLALLDAATATALQEICALFFCKFTIYIIAAVSASSSPTSSFTSLAVCKRCTLCGTRAPGGRRYQLLVEHMFARCPLLWVPLALWVSCKENKYNYLVSRYFFFFLLIAWFPVSLH